MRIGIVRRGYSETGGAEAYARRFADAAITGGHTCVLYTAGDWPADQWPGEIVRVKAEGPMNFARALRTECDVLFSLERVLRCDVYRAGDGVHAAWLERQAKFAPAWKSWLRGLYPTNRGILALEFALLCERGAGRVIANSKFVRKEIVRKSGYPEDRIDVIYNGLPPQPVEDGARAEMRAKLGIDEDEYVALFAGSGWERKGLRFAIEAVRRMGEDAPLLLVAGRGKPTNAGSRVRFLGPRNDVPRLLAAADVFVLPTIYDPFSNACLEAMAAGVPVITSRANGFAEIMDPKVEGDLLERPDDIDALIFSLCAWADPMRRENVRERLIAKGAEFSIERNLRETLAVLERDH
ncbi:MAG: glycosyltransferase family 4 protein [Chthoniobacteraceae bacterium]